MDGHPTSSSLSSAGTIGIGFPKTGFHFELIADREHPSGSGGPSAPPFRSSGQLPFTPLLATLRSGTVDVSGPMQLLIQANEYPGGRGSDGGGTYTNVHMERVWLEALRVWRDLPEHVEAAARPSEHVLRTLDGSAEPPTFAPLARCERTGDYIEPVCPSCLGAMSTCRDEALLRRSGLPSYRGTLTRFLHCESCARRERAEDFYTFDQRPFDGVASGVRVRRRSELYRDLAPQIKTGSVEGPDRHACFTCEYRLECYPSGATGETPIPAEAVLKPIAYYDFHFMPVEALPFDFDETAALLGGASSGELSQTDPAFDRGLQYFFRGDASGLFTLEVLLLKLSVFRELMHGVREFHRHYRRPHLALSAQRVRGTWARTASGVPARWGVRLSLWDVLTSVAIGDGDQVDRVWTLPIMGSELYAPQHSTGAPQTGVWMRVSVAESEVVRTGEHSVLRIVAEISAEEQPLDDVGAHDIVRIRSGQLSVGAESLVISGRKSAGTPRGFRFEGTSASLNPVTADALGRAPLPTSFSAEVSVLHSYHVPADVVSLGHLLLRLLVGKGSSHEGLADARTVARVAEEIANSPASEPGSSDARVRLALRRVLDDAEISHDPGAVLFRESDRGSGDSAVPRLLWDDVLILALRMSSQVAGWSVCGAPDDFDPAHPERPLDGALIELDSLIERSRGALFGSIGNNRVVLEVLDDFLADLRETAAAPMMVPTDAPEMTRIFKTEPPSNA